MIMVPASSGGARVEHAVNVLAYRVMKNVLLSERNESVSPCVKVHACPPTFPESCWEEIVVVPLLEPSQPANSRRHGEKAAKMLHRLREKVVVCMAGIVHRPGPRCDPVQGP